MAEDTQSTVESGEPQSLFLTLQGWVKEDRRVLGPWYREAREDFALRAGDPEAHWEKGAYQRLRDANKPCTTFNFIGPSVNSVAGMEVSNRQEVTYLPRTTQTTQQQPAEPGMPPAQPIPGADDTGPAEIFTAAGQYFRDQCDAEDEESDAFQDCATCGVGFTETRIDFDEDPAGKMLVDRCDPLEMGWDHRATKRNMVDSRRFHRVREMDKRAALEMFDGHSIEEIDAAWARPQNVETEPHNADKEVAYEQGTQTSEERHTVHVVEITWVGQKTTYTIANPETGEVMKELDRKQLKVMRKRAETAGIKLAVQAVKSKVYRQAFLGADSILDEDQDGTLCQSQKGFKFNAITGTRDRNKRQWVGIVRAMRDPQRWANALYSSVLNTIMTSGKGIMAERSAFENPQQAEQDWANASQITWLKPGALTGQNPAIVQKTPHNLPPAIFEMMQFAMQSLRDVSGVNIETLGLADRDQAASLEYQRRQAATTILAPFFDGLRRYRKEQGRLLLDLIIKYLSDGRLIRIVGPDYEKYIPLLRDPSVVEFDIIVSESPTSPNQKEASWMTIQQMLPVVGKNLGPNATSALLKASPLPETVVSEFQDAAQKDAEAAAQQPNPEMEKMQAELQMKQMDAQTSQEKAANDMALAQQKAAQDFQLKQMDVRLKEIELALAQFQAGAQLQQMQMQREDTSAKMAHDQQMRRMEIDGATEQETAKSAGPSLPALAKGLEALGKGISDGMQAQAKAIDSLAQATLAPRVTQLQTDANGMPIGAVSTAGTVN